MNELPIMWGWEPALYLFLGGLGAGTFAVAAVVYLASGQTGKKMLAASSWAAAVCLAVGLLLLIVELEAPLRGLMLWQSFSHFTSWMTFGAWVVFAALVIFGVTALLTTTPIYGFIAKKWNTLPEKRDKIVRILCIAGAVLGLGVAIYTGLLLMCAPGVPLWNTWLLPLLFAVSALDTGVALVVIILAVTKQGTHKISHALETSVVCFIILELAVLAAFVSVMLSGNQAGAPTPDADIEATAQMLSGAHASMAAASSAMLSLLTGEFAGWFWALFVGIGLIVPLLAAIYGLLPKAKHTWSAGLIGAVCALAGGCALRFLILYAAQHADIVGNAVAALL